MAVVSFMTTKGGAGKTTGSLLLGTILAEQGASVVMLDADPNQPLVEWAKNATLPPRMKIVGDMNEDNIQEAIEHYTPEVQFVIIDLEGSANLTAAYVMAESDAILIPLQPSKLDANEAAKTISFIKRQQKNARRELPTRVFWSRMPAAYTTKTARDLGEQFENAGIQFMRTRIIEREAFKGIVNFGQTLNNLTDADVPGLDKARENAVAFVGEAIELLRGGQK
ncbi:ParA family protein [Shinella sumterensis]|uniref:ParA family protein n=1 Tax=Shinella sumterensis TaxID=1967501 RepID=A0AA50CSS0_9HYPH|nr:ParA family protein [Shinella sumterensis]MBP8938376.1 ParA family protein [Agrobacterium sp.]WLS01364.1 ParA family protein [Shinella sumterensis]